MAETKKYRVVRGIAAHGGWGMENDGEYPVESHSGNNQDDVVWWDSTYLEVDANWGGDWRDANSVVVEIGDDMMLDDRALKAVESALETRADDSPLECGGDWGWVWEVEDDDFWDRAPEPPKCPRCGEPMALDRYVDNDWERGVIRVQGTTTRHWLYHHCYEYVTIDSGEEVE